MSKIIGALLSNTDRNPEKIAIRCDDISLSYEELAAKTVCLSNALHKRKVRRGDAIGMILPNSIEFVSLMLVAADLGAILVPLNLSLPTESIHLALKAANIKHIIGKPEQLLELQTSDLYDFSFVDGQWISLGDESSDRTTFSSLINEANLDVQPLLRGRPEDPYILTMTSGSTGSPKPIVLSQQTKWNRAWAASNLYDITESDIILAATPLYHSLAERLVLIPLLLGGTSILMSRYSSSEWLRFVKDNKVSFTIAVSSQLTQIARLLATSEENHCKSLRCLVSSSAPIDPADKADLLSKLQCQFHECYGTSEIAIASNLNVRNKTSKLDSVGIPVPNVDIRILKENDIEAPIGEIGEIVCKTPMLFKGYFRQAKLTEESMWNGYFRTGDLGNLDNDGYLYYQGRIKNIIITGGINVYPKDIETVIMEHPSILECAAFPLKDERLGEIVAVAVAIKNSYSFDKRKLRHFCARRLADFQQPQKWFAIDRLPRNEMGKIVKSKLSETVLTSEIR